MTSRPTHEELPRFYGPRVLTRRAEWLSGVAVSFYAIGSRLVHPPSEDFDAHQGRASRRGVVLERERQPPLRTWRLGHGGSNGAWAGSSAMGSCGVARPFG